MKNKKLYTFITSVILLAGVASAQAGTVSGVIKGAQCHLNNTQCIESKNDPRLILENDFILVSGSEYYFLTNLPRSQKLSIYNETVSIEGDISSNKIDVDRVVRKHGSKEEVIWDWNEIYEDLYES